MCRNATIRFFAGLALGGLALAQQPAKTPAALEWRRAGNSALELGLPSLATGAVERVWYPAGGGRLLARTASGRTFETSDFEQWRDAGSPVAPPEPNAIAASVPENGAKTRSQPLVAGRLYAFGQDAYRSDDGGVTWTNLTRAREGSIL